MKQPVRKGEEFMRLVYDLFFKVVDKSGAQLLMYKIGESSGWEAAKLARRREKVLKSELRKRGQEVCNTVLKKLGGGDLKIARLDWEKQEIVADVFKTPSLGALRDRWFHFERGLLAGVLGGLIRKRLHCKRIAYKYGTRKRGNKARLFLKIDLPYPYLAKEKVLFMERRELRAKLEQATKDIAAEKEKAFSIMRGLVDGLVLVDTQGKIVFINAVAKNHFDFFNDNVVGKELKKVDSSGYFYNLFKEIEKAKDSQKTLMREISFFTSPAKKEELFFKIILKEVRLASGEQIGHIFVIQDITREKVVDRLKTEFVSIAAHQLRTPLSSIKWTLNMLIEGDRGPVPPSQMELLRDACEANEAMIHLVDDLLNVSRMEEGRFGLKFKEGDIISYVKNVVDSFKEKTEKSKLTLELDCHIKESELKMLFDPDRLSLALGNLIENAIQYTPAGGKISVLMKKEGDLVEISVQDTGVGVPQYQQERIFTKFFRGDNVVKIRPSGTGLGLYLVKNIIESHGGKIWFKSEENKGTAFTFTLPLKRDKLKEEDK